MSKKNRSLQDYDMLKRKYDQGGVTFRQINLLMAFQQKCKQTFSSYYFLKYLAEYRTFDLMEETIIQMVN